MEVLIRDDPKAVAATAADLIVGAIAASPNPKIGVATGSSPVATYAELLRRRQRGELDPAGVHWFLLDEYVGLPPDDPRSYHSFICHHLAEPLDVARERVHGPDALLPDQNEAADRYEAILASVGGIDLQLLGIGRNGHIGFNEPFSSLGSRTRVKTLAASTRQANATDFGGDPDCVPRHVVSQGIATILSASRLLLIATGRHKAVPIAQAIEGPVTAAVPASALQLHPDAVVVIDLEAAAELEHAEYFIDVDRHRHEIVSTRRSAPS